MIKRKILTAALVAVGLSVSVGYRSVAQTGGGTTTTPGGTTTTPGDTTTTPGGTTTTPGGTTTPPGGTTTTPGDTTTPPGGSTTSPGGTTTTPSDTTTPPGGSTTSSPTQSSLSSSDKKFMLQAAEGGVAEVQLGQLALNKASSDQVKQYAQQMVDQHSQANNQLATLAAQKGVTLPTTIGSKYQSTYDKLSKLSGTAFDTAYMKAGGVKAHSQQADLYKREAQKGKDPDVKAFAAQVLPAVQDHLKMARDLTSGRTAGADQNQTAPGSTTTTPSGSSGGGSMSPSGGGSTSPSGGGSTSPSGGGSTSPGQ